MSWLDRLFACGALFALGCLEGSGPLDAALDGPSACVVDDDCDDDAFCNGTERCAPTAEGADARGCVSEAAPCVSACDEGADRCAFACDLDPDADDDGHDAIACGGDDCDDDDPRVSPSATELCDPEGVDEDCDGSTLGARDADGDGVVDAACCNGPRCGGDCDDSSASVRPGASEVCNDADDDCDGSVDEGIERTRYHPDEDRDGYGARGSVGVLACARPEGFADSNFDCDDESADVSPVSAERCNGEDDDCDGAIDELEGNVFYRDADADGWGDASETTTLDGCNPPDGYVARVGDCDDARASTHPGATERCNGRDDDCSAPSAPGGAAPEEDADGDGHAPVDAACEGGLPKDDCDDARAVAYLGAVETCSGRDEDCDGRVDEETDAQCASGTCEAGCVDHRTLAMSASAVCAITAGVPHCWGETAGVSGPGQATLALGAGGMSEAAPVALPITGARSLAMSYDVACVVLEDRTVRCWGGNADGQLGDGDELPRVTPVSPRGLANVVQVAVGVDSACALDALGDVRCWGNGERFALGDGGETSRAIPGAVLGLDRVVELVGANATYCARRYDGGVWCWGEGPLGDGAIVGQSVPRPVLDGSYALVAGGDRTRSFCARRDDGWWCWGSGLAFDEGGSTDVRTPIRLTALSESQVLALGRGRACGVRDDRTVACWGQADMLDTDPTLGGPRVFPAAASRLSEADAIACGTDGCCIETGLELRCQGLGNSLFFGDGAARIRGAVDAVGLDNARWITFGSLFDTACVADAIGTLRCFGAGGGPLGFPNESSRVYLEPVTVPEAPSDVVQVESTEAFTCARTGSGGVWCWGGDAMPGDGSTERARSPREVDGSAMGPASAIAVGVDFACALATDGAAWCWGATGTPRGALCGAGATVTSCPRPVAVVGGHDFVRLRAARSHVCGVTTTGAVWCWGFGGTGALGDGVTTGFTSEPVRAGAFDTAGDVALGDVHTCVLDGGRVHCVGSGSSGQLGDGSRSRSESFVEVLGLDDAVALRCSATTCLARRATGGWVAWGTDEGLHGAATLASQRNRPEPAAHGLTSSELWLGRQSACARRGDALACWGFGDSWEQRALPSMSLRSAF